MRDAWLAAFGLAFVVIALAVLIGVYKNVTADQGPTPTMTPTPAAVAILHPARDRHDPAGAATADPDPPGA